MEIDPYANAISHVQPGTFVPDIGPQAPVSKPLSPEEAGPNPAQSFKETVKSLLGDVNDKLVAADQASEQLATGQSHDFEGTIKSVEEATLAFQFTMAVRNKLMEAYTEIQQMQM
jgi:flagellar hook-basal body complex protein FliE